MKKNMKKSCLHLFKSLFALVLIVVVTITSSNVISVSAADNDLKVHYFNVGSADCMIVEKTGSDGKNHYMLIDAGFNDGNSKKWSGVTNWISWKQVKKFDYVIITHYDADHVNRLTSLLSGIEVGQFLGRKYSDTTLGRLNYAKNNYNSKYYDNYMKFKSCVRDKKGNENYFTSPKYGDTWYFPLNDNNQLGEVALSFMNKDTTYVTSNNYRDQTLYKEAVNDDSLVFHMTYKNSCYAFLGDLKKKGLQDYLAKGGVGTNSVLKIPHHGKYSNSTMPSALQNTFARGVKSKIAINSSDTWLSIAMNNALTCGYYLTNQTCSGFPISNITVSTNGGGQDSYSVYYEYFPY